MASWAPPRLSGVRAAKSSSFNTEGYAQWVQPRTKMGGVRASGQPVRPDHKLTRPRRTERSGADSEWHAPPLSLLVTCAHTGALSYHVTCSTTWNSKTGKPFYKEALFGR